MIRLGFWRRLSGGFARLYKDVTFFLIKLRSASTEASYRVFVDESFGRSVQVMIKVQTYLRAWVYCLHFHFSLYLSLVLPFFKVKMILKTNTKKKQSALKYRWLRLSNIKSPTAGASPGRRTWARASRATTMDPKQTWIRHRAITMGARAPRRWRWRLRRCGNRDKAAGAGRFMSGRSAAHGWEAGTESRLGQGRSPHTGAVSMEHHPFRPVQVQAAIPQ